MGAGSKKEGNDNFVFETTKKVTLIKGRIS